jgi:hypothetical protein
MPLQGHTLVPVMAVRVETKGASLAREETELCRSRWRGGQECGMRCLGRPKGMWQEMPGGANPTCLGRQNTLKFRVFWCPRQVWLLGVRRAGVWQQAETEALTCGQVMAAVGTWGQVSQMLMAWDLARLAVQGWRLPLVCMLIFKTNTSSKPRPRSLWLPAHEKSRSPLLPIPRIPPARVPPDDLPACASPPLGKQVSHGSFYFLSHLEPAKAKTKVVFI